MLDYTPTIGYDAFAHHGRKLITRFSERMQQPNAPLPIPADLDGIVSRVAKKTATQAATALPTEPVGILGAGMTVVLLTLML